MNKRNQLSRDLAYLNIKSSNDLIDYHFRKNWSFSIRTSDKPNGIEVKVDVFLKENLVFNAKLQTRSTFGQNVDYEEKFQLTLNLG